MVMSTLFTFLLNKAIVVADRVIDHVVDNALSTTPAQPAISIDDVIRQTTEQLTAITAASRDAIIAKIEADKLEELRSRIQNLGFVLRVGKANEALAYVLTVKESVDYAENRLREGKNEWLGAAIAGKTTVVAALGHLSIDSGDEAQALATLCKRARHQVLNQIVSSLVAAGRPVPWDEIHAFLERDPAALPVLEQLAAPSSGQTAGAAAGEAIPKDLVSVSVADLSRGKIDVVQERHTPAATVLQPATKWPFPTSSRP